MRHNIACCIQWKEQWNPRALGELPGQRLFCISTVKAQLNKTAVFLGSQDTGWPWTVALTLWDVYVHLLGFTILSVTLEASFQPAKVDFWSIPTTFLSAISQMGKGWIHLQWLVQNAWSLWKCRFVAWHREVRKCVHLAEVCQRVSPATQPPQGPGSALLTACDFVAAHECVKHRCSSWLQSLCDASSIYCVLHWVDICNRCYLRCIYIMTNSYA